VNRFSIKDLENLTGIKAHTIRIWEQRYGIFEPKRTPTNIRYYEADDLRTALQISLLNAYGYKISRIRQMNAEDMQGLIRKISDNGFRQQALSNELLEAALSMNAAQFEQILNEQISRLGLEATIEGPVFDFMQRVGLMWMSNHLAPAQEHIASHVIYRKLCVAIEQLPPAQDIAPVLLFLPEGEVHEISLLYVHYLLRRNGIPVLHLGANSPLREVANVAAFCKPSHLYTHLTSLAGGADSGKYLRRLVEAIPATPLLVSGAALKKKQPANLPHVRYLQDLAEVREAISKLDTAPLSKTVLAD
jgi:DNA-binding transcriptional MerR regulator